MTKNLKRLPKKILSNLESLSEKYLLYIISNQGLLRFRPWNSQIQYLVTNTHRIHLEQSVITYETLKALDIHNKSILNVGTGGGYLEYVCKYFNNPIHTVEYEDPIAIVDGVRAFKVIRDFFNIELDYTMSSILKDNFVINNCNKKYDYVILFRFMYHATAEQNLIIDYTNAYNILKKFKKYATNCIILGRKEWMSFHEFTSFDMKLNDHLVGNIDNILEELKTKLV